MTRPLMPVRREPRPEPSGPVTGPAWGARLLWAAYGLVAGYAAGILASLLLLSLIGPQGARFVFRVCVYGCIFAGVDYGGERPRLRRSLLRGFGLGAGIAVLRDLLAFL